METKEILSFFAKYIEHELGIVYDEGNYFQLQNRLEEIATLLGVKSLPDLFVRAQSGIEGSFKQLLLDCATNNETFFFRDLKVFRAIEAVVLKAAIEQAWGVGPFRIWSAASSTGQEPLSIAMLMTEYLQKTNHELNYSILGTDISERALARAKSGVYSQLEVQRGLPAPLLIKYFTKDDQDRWQASDTLRKKIEYQKVNLTRPFPFVHKFQLILCRNVLIYQTLKLKTEILNRITADLAPGGYLVLGSGESLIGISEDYEQCLVDGAVLYRKKSGGNPEDVGLNKVPQSIQPL